MEENDPGVVGLLFFRSPHNKWPVLAYFHLAIYSFLSPELCCFSKKTWALANFDLYTRQTFQFYFTCFCSLNMATQLREMCSWKNSLTSFHIFSFVEWLLYSQIFQTGEAVKNSIWQSLQFVVRQIANRNDKTRKCVLIHNVIWNSLKKRHTDTDH